MQPTFQALPTLVNKLSFYLHNPNHVNQDLEKTVYTLYEYDRTF